MSDSSPNNRALVCVRHSTDTHHLRFAQAKAPGRKVAMSSLFPCAEAIIMRFIAAAMKRPGDKRAGVDPLVTARAFG